MISLDYSITIHNNGELRIFSFDEVVRDNKIKEIYEKFESVTPEEEHFTLISVDVKGGFVGEGKISEVSPDELHCFALEDLKGIIEILEK